MDEALQKARHDFEFAMKSFRDALADADPVAALIVLDLLRDTTGLFYRLEAFMDARAAIIAGQGIATNGTD